METSNVYIKSMRTKTDYAKLNVQSAVSKKHWLSSMYSLLYLRNIGFSVEICAHVRKPKTLITGVFSLKNSKMWSYQGNF